MGGPRRSPERGTEAKVATADAAPAAAGGGGGS
eukprot:COSAG06_NODE_19420_length_839_cov_1.445946_1_plen_32_part_10